MTSPHAIPCLTRPGRDTCQPRFHAAISHEANRRPNSPTISLTDLLTDWLIDWMIDLTICAKASRARRKKRRASALRHAASPSSQKARWNSQLSRLEKSACAPGKVAPRDLALIRLRQRPPQRVVALKLAEQEPLPAQRVHSVGNPGASGALWIYSSGLIRQVYRKEWRYVDGPARVARVIEMQSPINPGHSGGPVVNDSGELVGVVSGKRTEAALMSWCIAGAEVKAYLAFVEALIEPKTAVAFHRRGVRTLERGLATRAVEDLSAAYRLNPKSADILADRAMAYRERRDYDLAFDDIAEALRLNPRHAPSFNVRGCIYTDRAENDTALREFRRAIQISKIIDLTPCGARLLNGCHVPVGTRLVSNCSSCSGR